MGSERQVRGSGLQIWCRLAVYEAPADSGPIRDLAGLRPALVRHNVANNQLFDDLLNTLVGNPANSMLITCLALGDGVISTVSRTDTELVNEWNRYVPISQTVSAADPPELTLNFFSPATDGAIILTEAGLFAGGAQQGVPGSGVMYSHLLFPYSKGSNTDLTFTYTLTRDAAT
jgi:hypothetical protein